MKGGIYCGVCYKPVGPEGCRKHPGRFFTRFGKIGRRFDSFTKARSKLWYYRGLTVEDKFDERDHQIKKKPLAPATLLAAFINSKEAEGKIKPHQLKTYQRWANLAIAAWGDINIKDIGS